MSSDELLPDPDLIEAIAQRVAELLDESARTDRPGADLIDAAELARRLGMDRSWVYSHAAELGAVRLGTGPNARLRFDPERATGALNPVGDPPPRSEPPRRPARRRPRRRRAPLLPVKGVPASEHELVQRK
jgi:hypothetical protein